MMRIALTAFAVLSASVLAQDAKSAETVAVANNCPIGLYGENCASVCAGCEKGVACGVDGSCTCATGWAKSNGGLCEPMCFGAQGRNGGSANKGCENDGECVAPDYCICGKSGAQVVGVEIEEGKVQCVSLRKDGIKGAFISLAVMFLSISFCGIVERQRNKGK